MCWSQRTLQAFYNSASFHFLYHGGALQHCKSSCIQAYSPNVSIEVSSGSCTQGDVLFPKHRYNKFGESSSLHCKAFASSDFHTSLFSVVVCGFAVFLQIKIEHDSANICLNFASSIMTYSDLKSKLEFI